MLTLGIGSKISLVPFATSQQTTLLVEGIVADKHRLVAPNIAIWFNKQYAFFSQEHFNCQTEWTQVLTPWSFEKLSFSFAEGSTCVDGELRHKGFKGSRCLEINSAGYLVVHLFSILILVGVQAGNWRAWKFVLRSVNLDNHWCNSMWILEKKIS